MNLNIDDIECDEGKFTFERINNRIQKTQGINLQSSIRNCLLKQNTIL